ncbi:MAG TPA: hypothetical protein VHC97_13500 [Thermoanaerobaculia bacterium]|nr:hypothetical protein [Thermoanaerobaculia bacterium]
MLGTSQTIVVKVDAWFDTVMDRTSEVFKYYTRQITILMAVLFALLLHVDSLAILTQLSQDPAGGQGRYVARHAAGLSARHAARDHPPADPMGWEPLAEAFSPDDGTVSRFLPLAYP